MKEVTFEKFKTIQGAYNTLIIFILIGIVVALVLGATGIINGREVILVGTGLILLCGLVIPIAGKHLRRLRNSLELSVDDA